MPSSKFKEFLTLRSALPRPGPNDPVPSTAARRRMFLDSAPAAAGVEPITVVANGVTCEYVTSRESDPDRRLLYLHGGGFTVGSHISHRRIAADLAKFSGTSVLNVNYRLAPEHVYPAQLEDAVQAYEWMLDNGPTGTGPASSTVVAGDSAGGGLALALLLSLRDSGERTPNAAVTFSAWTDMAVQGKSVVTRAACDPIITSGLSLQMAAKSYLGGADARTPKASPAYADFTGLPPLYLNVGDNEVLLDDTLSVAAQASSAGVSVTLHVEPGGFHVYPFFVPDAPESMRLFGSVAEFLRDHQ